MSTGRTKHEPSPHLLNLQKKLASLEEPPDKNLNAVIKVEKLEEPKFSIDDGWAVKFDRFILKDREPLQVKGRRRQIVYGSIYSRLKLLPLIVSFKGEEKSFVEMSIGIDNFPSRKDYIIKSTGEPITLEEAYKKEVRSENSIKLAIYFYAPDTLTITASFKCKIKSVDKSLLNWTQKLDDYSPYLNMRLQKPRRSNPTIRSKSQPKTSNQTAEGPENFDPFDGVVEERLQEETPSGNSGLGTTLTKLSRLQSILLKSGVRMVNRTQQKFSKTLGNLDITRRRNGMFVDNSPAKEKSLVKTSPSFFSQAVEGINQNISPELANSTRGFFIRLSDRKVALKSKVADIQVKAEEAQKKRSDFIEESKQHTLDRLEEKRRKVEIRNKIIKETMNQLMHQASLRAWMILLVAYRMIFFSERRIAKTLQSRKNMRVFFKCSLFIGNLIHRVRFNKKHKPQVVQAQSEVVLRMVALLRRPRVLKSCNFMANRALRAMCGPWLLLDKSYKFKNKMSSTCSKLISHIKRKKNLKAEFLEGLRHVCGLLDRKRNQVNYKYTNFDASTFADYFEVIYQLKLNEAWIRQAEFIVNSRNAVIKKNLTRNPKFKEAMERISLKNNEDKYFRMKGFERYEFVEHYLQVNHSNIEAVVHALLKNITMFGGFSGSLTGIELKSKQTTSLDKQQRFDQKSRAKLIRATGGFLTEEISIRLGFADYVGLLLGATAFEAYLEEKRIRREELLKESQEA